MLPPFFVGSTWLRSVWADFKRRPLAWIIGVGLLLAGLGFGLAFLVNRADYERFRAASPCTTTAFPSPDDCFSDFPARVTSVVYSPGSGRSASSGSITVDLAGGSQSVSLVNGDDATQFKQGDAVTARAWRSDVVAIRSTADVWVDTDASPTAANSMLSGLAMAGIGVGSVITALLWIGALRRRSAAG